jgi:hypothetical protein
VEDSAAALTGASGESVLLEQNWTRGDRDTFHRITEGGALLPVAWLRALELPGDGRLVLDPAVLDAFGAIPDPGNPLGLPVGVVTTPPPPGVPAQVGDFYGFNCAFCHTGELSYRGRHIRVEGGGATWNVSGYVNAITGAIVVTYQSSLPGGDPGMFDRFAARVLGPSAANEAKEALRNAFAPAGANYAAFAQAIEVFHLAPIPEGTARLDAMARLANVAFGPLDPSNLTAMAAPVSFPPLWDTEAIDFKHYSGGIRLSLARDILTALGIGASVDPATGASTVAIANLHTDESLASKLRPPAWPELFGGIDRGLASRGRAIYRAECASCHEKNEQNGVIVQKLVPLLEIGTDPVYAQSFHDKQIATGPWGFGTVSYPEALEKMTTRVLDAAGESSAGNAFVGNLGYKARPLDGVWATAPYLHNGSVLSLYELLLPASQRRASFGLVPHQEFDPKHVGLVPVPGDATSTFDTTKPGNGNGGHEYGTQLCDADRWALLEYLKSL